jgi:hypothetical protein
LVLVAAASLTLAVAGMTAQSGSIPNPYREDATWAKLPAGAKWGGVISIDPASNGDMWVFHRSEPPVMRFDPSGKVVKSFGAGLIVQAHGMTVDRDGNVWVTDAQIKDGKVRVLAVGDSKRTAVMPEVPTMAEAGMPQLEAENWYGMIAPANSSISSAASSWVASARSSWYAGPLSWRLPRNSVTLPANSPCRPTESSRSRHGWLKNVSFSVPRPSVISASTIDPRRALEAEAGEAEYYGLPQTP